MRGVFGDRTPLQPMAGSVPSQGVPIQRSMKHGGRVLTAIISRFDRQLLGNKLSFPLCSMHILFDSNKFHKFWMSYACRDPLSKDGRNQRKSRPPGTFRADRPDTSIYMGPILLLEQYDMFERF